MKNLYEYSIFRCPKSDRAVYAWLFILAILSSLILIANPSFYSYDELKKVEHIMLYGFAEYCSKYMLMESGDSFLAIRPVSYLVEGLVSLFLPGYPFLVHFFDVLMHGAVALLLFVSVLRLTGNRQLAWIAAIIFLINPLVSFSIGWSGALMDRLFVLFGLAAFLASHHYITRQRGNTALIWVFAASTLAILSKETAIVLPGLLAVYPLFSLVTIRSKLLWTAFVVWCAPMVLFLLYRLPALINTFGEQSASPYSGSFSNVPEGIFTYFIYPFLPLLTEAHIWGFQSPLAIGAAVVVHLILLMMLWRAFSIRVVLAYLVGYFIFLFPVLFIPGKGAHYLYGSGIAFSVALGALLTLEKKNKHRIFILVSIAFLVFAVSHTLVNQLYFYKTGMCMSKIESTIESAYLADNKPEKMTILIEPDAPGYVLRRFTHKKIIIGSHFPVEFEVVDWDKRNEVKSDYVLNCDCIVSKVANDVLAGLQCVKSDSPFCGIGTINKEKAGKENVVEKQYFIRLQGWAIDPAAQKLASKVYVTMNGKTYTTQYGGIRERIAKEFNNPELLNSGFLALIPLADFSPAINTISVKVVSYDNASYYSGEEITIQLK